MNHAVFFAALAFLLVVVLGLSAGVRPPTVITRALVAALASACLAHMSSRWLAAEHVAEAQARANAKALLKKEADPA